VHYVGYQKGSKKNNIPLQYQVFSKRNIFRPQVLAQLVKMLKLLGHRTWPRFEPQLLHLHVWIFKDYCHLSTQKKNSKKHFYNVKILYWCWRL